MEPRRGPLMPERAARPAPVPAQMWASPGAAVGQSRRRCGPVPAQMWASPGADVGQSRRRCGPVPAQMWASPGADVGQSRRRCGPPDLLDWSECKVQPLWPMQLLHARSESYAPPARHARTHRMRVAMSVSARNVVCRPGRARGRWQPHARGKDRSRSCPSSQAHRAVAVHPSHT
jgi:hypothetical protein